MFGIPMILTTAFSFGAPEAQPEGVDVAFGRDEIHELIRLAHRDNKPLSEHVDWDFSQRRLHAMNAWFPTLAVHLRTPAEQETELRQALERVRSDCGGEPDVVVRAGAQDLMPEAEMAFMSPRDVREVDFVRARLARATGVAIACKSASLSFAVDGTAEDWRVLAWGYDAPGVAVSLNLAPAE